MKKALTPNKLCAMIKTPNKLGITTKRKEIVNLQLRAARKQSGKTQVQVAKETGISVSQYQNIEYGKHEPGVRTAIRIARVLGTTAEELFEAATPEEEREMKIL